MTQEYKEGISVFVTVYKTKEYVDACIDSIYAQSYITSHDNWEVIVFCDGDDECYEHLIPQMFKRKNFKLLRSAVNFGTYISSNTAAREAQYSWLLRVDSDDTLTPDCLWVGSKLFSKYDYITFHRIYPESNEPKPVLSIGNPFIRHTLFDQMGGYQPWRISADAEFYFRCKNICRNVTIDNVLVVASVRNDSLTKDRGTGLGTPARKLFQEISRIWTNPLTMEDARIPYRTCAFDMPSAEDAFRAGLLEKAKYVCFPVFGKRYNVYEKLEREGKSIYNLPLGGRMYEIAGNEHHYLTSYTYDYVIPPLSLMFNFNFNRADFNLKENIVGGGDFSYLVPKKDYKFTFEDFNTGEIFTDLVYDGGIVNTTIKEYATDNPFHNLFIGNHKCCKITNENAPIQKTILLSCDSQMIPSIPILCCYFRTVIHMDNRTSRNTKEDKLNLSGSKSFLHKIFGDTVDYVCVALYVSGLYRYLKINLK